MLFLSKATEVSPIKDTNSFELVNLFSGKCFKVDLSTLKLLCACEGYTDKNDLQSKLMTIGYNYSEAISIATKLLSSNILIRDNINELIELKSYNHTLFGMKSFDMTHVPESSICVVGIPFGNGNAVDNRCKEFPKHIRNFTFNHFGNRDLFANIDNLNYNAISSSFNLQNLKRLIDTNLIHDCGDILHICGEDNSTFYNRVYNTFNTIIYNNHNITLSIGGDHSIIYPILKALCNYNSKFYLIQFDAHSDYRKSKLLDFYYHFNILNHANVINYCSKLSAINGIYQIGVREPFIPQNKLLHNISIDMIRQNLNELSHLLSFNLPIYISIDVDFFDPSIIQGTGSKLPCGAYLEEAFIILKHLISNHTVLGIDIVEANHRIDKSSMTTNIVMQLILFILSLLNPNK